jgi:catechol 2,3-dioxygenase-like lactoylglutathione lyase family enzyme
MKLLRAATLTTPDVDAAADRYQRWLDYRVVETGTVAADLAASWGAPASAGRRFAVLQPASGAEVFIRFVEGDVPADYLPLRTFGWAAIEICVQDTLAVNMRMETSPFEIIGPPKQLDGLPAIFPMQVRGPDGEIVYLTEIRADLPDYDLPRAGSLIDKLFILVLACSDMDASARWFRDTLGIQHGREMEIIYSMINNAFDLPADTRHRLATGIHERDCFLEFDQYPQGATARPGDPDALPPGVAMTTLLHPDIDAIPGEWVVAPTAGAGPVYGGRRAGVLRAPDGTRVEVVAI